MAMTSCAECANSVSDKAASCPHCGAPIASQTESRGSGTQLTTTQETSKKLKMHTIASSLVFVVGFSLLMTAPAGETGGTNIAASMTGIGFIWFLVTRFRIWWHHG